MRAFVAAISTLALVGCAQGAVQSQTIAQFERGQVDAAAHKQWGKLYDTLHPAQRRLIPYKDFSRCMITGDAFARSFGIDTSTGRFVRARVVKQERMTIPESKVHVMATVVKTATSFVEGGKRVVESDVDYLVKHNGQWRWIDPDIKPSEFKTQSCGIIK